MASSLVTSVVSLTGKIFTYLNTVKSKEYLDRSVEIELAILKEEKKGYNSDDTKLGDLEDELAVIAKAAEKEFDIAMKKGDLS